MAFPQADYSKYDNNCQDNKRFYRKLFQVVSFHLVTRYHYCLA